MAASKTSDLLNAISVEDIENEYRAGKITREQHDKLLSAKARLSAQVVSNPSKDSDNIVSMYIRETIKEAQKGWDNFVEAVVRERKASVKEDSTRDMLIATRDDAMTELWYQGLAAWGGIQAVSAPLTALGTVIGKKAEDAALWMGASPGLAKLVGISADIGSGFVPTGLIAKSFVKTTEATLTKGSKLSQAAGSALSPKVLEPVVEKPQEVAQAAKGIVTALAADGVTDATKVLKVPGVDKLDDIVGKIEDLAALGATYAPKLTGNLGKDARAFRNLASQVSMGKASPEEFMRAATQLITGEVLTGKPRLTKDMMNMLTEWAPEMVAQGDIHGAITKFAHDVGVLQSGRVRQLLEKAQSTFRDVNNNRGMFTPELVQNSWYGFRELYVNSLLPYAAIPSFIGNATATAAAITERAAGALFSASKQGYNIREPFYMMQGIKYAMGDALKAFGEAYRYADMNTVATALGKTKDEIRKMPAKQLYDEMVTAGFNPSSLLQNQRLDFIPGEIPGIIGRIARAPGDTVKGMDNIFKVMLARASDYAYAIRTGHQQGLTGAALDQHLANLLTPFGPKPAAMVEEARSLALTGTFQNDLGRVAQGIKSVAQAGPGWLWFPFMKTPIDLTKYAWNRTPGLQLISTSLYQDIVAGGARADAAIGRLTMSNFIGAYVYELAKEGYITGAPPTDPALRAAWLAKNRPYSVRTKDGWIPITNMDPATSPIGAIADMTQIADQLDEMSFSQAMTAIGFTIMNNFSDNSWWQGMSNLVDAVQGLKAGKEISVPVRDFLAQPAVNIATGGALFNRIARIVDPIMRETREDIVDVAINRIPGRSKEVPAKRDGYGDVIIPPQAMGNSWFGLFSPLAPKFSPDPNDRIKNEGARLEANLPDFEWTIGGTNEEAESLAELQPGDSIGTNLTAKQRSRWQEIYKNFIRHPEMGLEATLLNTDQYKKATDPLKRQLFSSTLSNYKNAAKSALLLEDEELGLRSIRNDVRTVLPLLQSQQQVEVQQQSNQALSLYQSLRPEQLQNLTRWGVLEGER